MSKSATMPSQRMLALIRRFDLTCRFQGASTMAQTIRFGSAAERQARSVRYKEDWDKALEELCAAVAELERQAAAATMAQGTLQ